MSGWCVSALGVVLAMAAAAHGAEPAAAPAALPALAAPPAAAAEQVIDLPGALALGGADNPTIAIAAQAAEASAAQLQQARALLLPTLNAGGSVNLHQGNLLSAGGVITDVNRQSAYAGAGAFAVGSGTVGVPGVRLTSDLADAIFAPAAAGHALQAQRFNAVGTRNRILLAVALRYFDLVGAEAQLAVVRQSQADFNEVVRLTANFAKAGQGRAADADRARGYALLLETQDEAIQEAVAVAGAELAGLLSLHQGVRLRAAEPAPPLLHLVAPAPLPELIAVALRERPEVHAAAAAVAAAQTQQRQEKCRPYLPVLSVGYSNGTFGGGIDRGPRFADFDSRGDFDAAAYWSLDNLGAGNRALQRQRRAVLEQAAAQRSAVVNQVQREVADAVADAAARLETVTVARRQVERAADGFQLDLARARNLEGRPIEVLNSATNLAGARLELVRSIVGYTQAQFRLFVALGEPPSLPCQP